MSADPPPPQSPPARSRRRVTLIVAVLAAAGAVFIVAQGLASRLDRDAHLKAWTDAQAVQTVAVVTPTTGGGAASLNLPGRLEAYSRAALYSRVAGYLKSFTVDIGSKVSAGQVLAEIEAPDIDQQLLQARAALASSEASEALAESTARRWQSLTGTNGVSRQTIDEKLADYSVKQALTKAARANVERLESLANFKRILAPFDGIVTARNTDLGALINADNGSGQPLFVISDVRKLRVYVSVPQASVPAIRPGTKAQLSVPEYPARFFTAVVESSAQSVDPASGTTRMQLVVENSANELMPGAYAFVRLDLPRNTTALSIPASALIFNQSGMRVATVNAQDRVALKTVIVGRDLGRMVELASGLDANDRVIESPPDGINEGDAVKVIAPPPPPQRR